MALVYNGTVVEFISYEGTLTATDGPANGMTSVDIGVSEDTNTPAGYSLQRQGNGTQASDFIWVGPLPETKGFPNTDQSLPVTLKTFYATIARTGVILHWITESEINNAGFIIYKKEEKNADFVLLDSYKRNPALKGAGNSTQQTRYTFKDPYVVKGKTYWYQLADVAVDGTINILSELKITVTDVEENLVLIPNLPEKFEVYQNYPNPFNPSTLIPFDIPQSAQPVHVSIEIFNINGKLVKSLLNNFLSAGSYQMEWDGTNNHGERVPTGFYFAKITAGKYQKTIKMVLLK